MPRCFYYARTLIAIIILGLWDPAPAQDARCESTDAPKLLVLGTAQDAGYPQTGSHHERGFNDFSYRHFAASLALHISSDSTRWMFDATPDFREQLYLLHEAFPGGETPGLAGIFLTHAHIGHYLGLAQLGHEVMGAHDVPVYAMPRMRDYLSANGPWDQLVRYKNIALMPMEHEVPIKIGTDVIVTPMLVPHRDEYAETVGFGIEGPSRSALFLPDINKWEEWDERGVRLEDVVSRYDLNFLDATFFRDGELPGRDMSAIKHPFIAETMDRLQGLDAELRSRVYFIHLNHTNPALDPGSPASAEIVDRGFRVARQGQCFDL